MHEANRANLAVALEISSSVCELYDAASQKNITSFEFCWKGDVDGIL